MICEHRRGFADAAAGGPDFAGVLCPRRVEAWRSFKRRAATRAVCLDTLRRCKEAQENHPDSPCLVSAVLPALGCGPLNAGDISEHGLATRRRRGRLAARLGRLIDAPPPLATPSLRQPPGQRFRAVFLGLCRPVDRRHQLAPEQAIQDPPWSRKVCGATAGPEGRRHPAGTGRGPAHRPPTPPRPARPSSPPMLRSSPTHSHCRRLLEAHPNRPSLPLLPPSGWLEPTVTACTCDRQVPARGPPSRGSRGVCWRTGVLSRSVPTHGADPPTGILEVCFAGATSTSPSLGGLPSLPGLCPRRRLGR